MSKKAESVEQTYKKVSQIQHVILRPDTYIGSTEVVEEPMWILDDSTSRFRQEKIKYIPGLYKIFDQVLVNAADNFQRDQSMSRIDVTIDQKTGLISIRNDGKSIPVQIHRQHKIYVAELIFGHLLTSSNYQDKKKKVTGGRNGYGAKLANIFSSFFAIETADSASRKLLKIEWRRNMSQMSNPETVVYQGKDYTKVTFIPDFQKFSLKGLTDEMVALFKRRVYDMAGILKCSVYLNGSKIKVSGFEDYCKLYLNNCENEELIYDAEENTKRWHVIVTRSQGQFQHVSFVNGIYTNNGGTHVNHVCDQIVEKLLPSLNKKVKDITIKPFQIKAHFRVFINCLVENPSFTSQTKDTLTTKAASFGSEYFVSDKMIKMINKSGISERILNQLRMKENTKIDKHLKKLKNTNHHLVIPKLEDANMAGRATNCTLILTEGDSAKALAMAGIEHLGRDYYGVFPLRGKVINVREMTNKQVMSNFQLSNVVKIIGLSFQKVYTHTNDLRYSSVMIMADQDNDGSHIKGLILNFFYTFWPSLCEIPGFLKEFVTPIIRCRRGNQREDFFCQGDYQIWKAGATTDWKIKYYKGLGTSTSAQAKQYFSNLGKHEIKFKFEDEEDKNCFDLAFSKKKADDRKHWLETFDQRQNVDYNVKELKIQDFFNKEFRHFSISDNVRSIPSIMDGLKPSQRKVLYACFKRNLRNQIKVAQLAGYVAEHSAYHHGEMSLCSTIISMAQNYVGSNNLNLLEPIGQFGTRHLNGKDHASARYVFTCLNTLTRYLFNQADDHIVDYIEEQNLSIEPKYYYPILPLILINGSDGIGTGWSTTVHPHRVSDVIQLVRERIKGQYKYVSVGWQNFTGEVVLENRGVFLVKGVFQVEGDTVNIKEIPVGKSIRDYKTFLQQKVKSLQNQDPDIEEIKEYHTGDQVDFVINFMEGKMPDHSDLEKYLKLESKVQQTNMTLFNPEGKIQRYQTTADIIEAFYKERMNAYSKRREYLLSKHIRECEILESKISFINAVMIGKFKMMEKKESWVRQLAAENYKKYHEITRIQSTKLSDNDADESSQKQYNYLLSLPIWSFCQEKVVELECALEQAKKMIHYYQNIDESEMWLKDLEQFEEAWSIYQSGRSIQTHQRRQEQTKRKRQRIEPEMAEPPTTKRVNGNRRKKNLMQEAVQDEKQLAEFKFGKKIIKGADTYLYEPVKVPSPKKEEDKITSLLSKYLAPSQDNPGNSLADRIKARINRKDQCFESSYKEAMENKDKEDNQAHNMNEDQMPMKQGQKEGEGGNKKDLGGGSLADLDLDWLE